MATEVAKTALSKQVESEATQLLALWKQIGQKQNDVKTAALQVEEIFLACYGQVIEECSGEAVQSEAMFSIFCEASKTCVETKDRFAREGIVPGKGFKPWWVDSLMEGMVNMAHNAFFKDFGLTFRETISAVDSIMVVHNLHQDFFELIRDFFERNSQSSLNMADLWRTKRLELQKLIAEVADLSGLRRQVYGLLQTWVGTNLDRAEFLAANGGPIIPVIRGGNNSKPASNGRPALSLKR